MSARHQDRFLAAIVAALAGRPYPIRHSAHGRLYPRLPVAVPAPRLSVPDPMATSIRRRSTTKPGHLSPACIRKPFRVEDALWRRTATGRLFGGRRPKGTMILVVRRLDRDRAPPLKA